MKKPIKVKGFTLIELLAVIVVLAIILVIAVPRILGIIEESKKESLRVSGENLIKAAKDKQVKDSLTEVAIEKTYTIESGAFVGESIPMSGALPENGTISIKADGSVGIALLKDGYCMTKSFDKTKSFISKDIENCIIIEETPETCFGVSDVSSTEVKIISYLESCTKEVIIPTIIGSKTVVSIGENAFHSNQLTSVTIPNSVTSIGIAAFNDNALPDNQAFIYARNSDGSGNFSKLVSYGGINKNNVLISNSVTSIGDGAFLQNQLTSVIIPASLELASGSNNPISSTFHNAYNPLKQAGTYTAPSQSGVWTKQ